MPENEKKGITVKIDAQLHAQVKAFIEAQGMTMAEFVSKALDDELHPKITQEVKNMGNMRTMAFQVPEELFQQIKDYLNRHNMTQKEFVIGLITTELERDMALRNGVTQEQTAPDEAEEETETEDEDLDETEEETESEDEDIDEEEAESEGEELDDDESEDIDEDEDEDEDFADDEESEDEDETESEDESMSLGM